jgi:hypothetical protein
MKAIHLSLLIVSLTGLSHAADRYAKLERAFTQPPASSRPWVYWFWLNGNITSNGVTADLEAMARVGIGGVLIMEVDQGAPKGPAAFGQPGWRELFKHVTGEAHRLGLEVNMNNDAGWCGSGGPWITPDLAMQKVVWSETNVQGPMHFSGTLAEPKATAKYYRDIMVLAFPTPAGDARIEGIQGKAAFTPTFVAPQASFTAVPADQTVARDRVVALPGRLDAAGRLDWEVPAGQWTIVRFGHTPTGKDNHPAPEAGRGLECDKLSRKAAEVMFDGLMGKLVTDSKSVVGKSLVATHIDSWEVGSQNWTPLFREEFRKRRGYDMFPFLPAMTGRVVENMEVSERFLWDLRQTISELVLENYAGCFRELAQRHGLRLSIEAYTTCPVDELAYAGRADEPMGEFWSWPKYGSTFSCTEMTGAAHAYGKRIVGAEAFTATDGEKWLGYPGDIKDLGDWAFCEGINRFVFHRYAMQPWTGPVRPGMSMGPWGLHYERTETWWEQSKAWHEYLARCQFLLQQGLFVADLCLLSPEGSPQTIDRQKAFLSHTPGAEGQPLDRPGHNFDTCSPEVVLTRMSVKGGKLVLPDGMSWRLLALPRSETMTPNLLRKIKELVHAGATVAGNRPVKSPSLSGYPACDAELKALADELWGTNDITAEVTELRYGKGRILCGTRFGPDRKPEGEASSRVGSAKWIWHKEGNPAVAAPVGARYFRRLVDVEPGSAIDSARLLMTVDNSFQCWVNGKAAGSGDDFTRLYDRNITRLLRPGSNLITVKAVNGATAPNPAGMIGLITIKYHDGRNVTVPTDGAWESSVEVKGNWRSDAAQAGGWGAAMVLGPMGMAPWGDVERRGANPDLYPDIELLGQLLDERGVAPDFACTPPDLRQSLRFIHKSVDGAEVYFVANRTPEPRQGLCLFRVQGKRPELWRPQTGEIVRPAVYDELDGRMSVPLHFEPYESVFVVFPANAKLERDRIVSVTRDGEPLLDTKPSEPGPAANTSKATESVELVRGDGGQVSATLWQPGRYALKQANGGSGEFGFAALPAPLELTGPWQVDFAPGGGAPSRLSFETLMSWPHHPDQGVKYFSGAATYTKSFAVPAGLIGKSTRLYLDLGKVAVMADVRLNGKALGTLWKAPFRVEVTDALKAGENVLEVRVVNLWVNRQIGDELLPEDSDRNPNGTLKQWPQWLEEGKPSPTGRYTFTSWRLWKKNSPLQQSGLLGPVTISAAEEIAINGH